MKAVVLERGGKENLMKNASELCSKLKMRWILYTLLRLGSVG